MKRKEKNPKIQGSPIKVASTNIERGGDDLDAGDRCRRGGVTHHHTW